METILNHKKPIQLMRKRYSCRSYQRVPIPPDKQDQLRDLLLTLTHGPLGTTSRFMLIAADENDRQSLKGLSTYGFIKNPTGFILGATTHTAHSLEDFGYLQEHAVLFATSLDLGTVWLGGTFNKGRFAEKLELTEAEQLPAVIAMGLIAVKPRAFDAVIRRQARAQNRKAWDQLFFSSTFALPLDRETAGPYAVALDMVQCAPSASNKQPWRIVRDGHNWHFYMQRTKGYASRNTRLVGVADMQRIDMGIAMCHFSLAAAESGLTGRWISLDPGIEKPDALIEYTVTWTADTD